jgi:hypothetical protein
MDRHQFLNAAGSATEKTKKGMNLRVSTPEQDPPLQAAKWLQIQMLLDDSEMEALFNELGEFFLFQVGSLLPKGAGAVSKGDFLKHYSSYIATLKAGEVPAPASYRPYFSCVLTNATDALYAFFVDDTHQLIRVTKPIVQLQAHSMHFSHDDHKFRPMVFGPDSIVWGVQFSYPQIVQDPIANDIIRASECDDFSNTKLFRAIQQWQRKNTVPTPFVFEGEQQNVPMRLGKKCFSWINSHPQLKSLGITVATK